MDRTVDAGGGTVWPKSLFTFPVTYYSGSWCMRLEVQLGIEIVVTYEVQYVPFSVPAVQWYRFYTGYERDSLIPVHQALA